MGRSRWMLVVVEGPYVGQRLPISERGFSFGRDADNDLVLQDDNVSRHHAIVHVTADRPVLEDLKSRNGTFVNNQKVARLELQDGDRIALGAHLFKVVPLTGDAVLGSDPERTIVRHTSPSDLRATRALNVNLASADGSAASRYATANLATPENFGVGVSYSELDMAPSPRTGGGPILGGAAASLAAQSSALQLPPGSAPELPQIAMPYAGSADPLPPQHPVSYAPPPPAPSRRWVGILAGTLTMLVAGIVGVIALRGGNPAAVVPEGAPSQSTALEPTTSRATAPEVMAISGTTVLCEPAVLSAEEQALSSEEKVARANEHIDDAGRYMASDQLKQACAEFERSLALNPDCKVCLIRISKVKAEIKKTLEKYEGDAIRSFQAMEYDKAVRYWQMVHELESDPAGRRRATDEILKARSQLHQQSYR